MFQAFRRPRAREQVAMAGDPASTVLVAQSEKGVLGVAVLLTRAPSGSPARCRAR